MTEQPISPERGAELERQVTRPEYLLADTPVQVGDWLRFEVDEGWRGVSDEEGEIVQITDRSIFVSYKPLRGERKRARISRTNTALKQRHVKRLFNPGEKEEYRRWRAADAARRERESQVREQQRKRERLEYQARLRALDLLALEHPDRLAELIEQVRPGVEAQAKASPW